MPARVTWRLVLLVVAALLFVAALVVALGQADGNFDALVSAGLAAWAISQLP